MEKPDVDKVLFHLKNLALYARGPGLVVLLPNDVYLAMWMHYQAKTYDLLDWDFGVPKECTIHGRLLVKPVDPDSIQGTIHAL